jgi:rhamnosyltransferase
MRNVRATIFIPVYNGERDNLEGTLSAVCNQKTDYLYEILIANSSSTDNSVEIIKKYQKKHKNIILKEIDKKDFSHGGTRQQAAEWGSGQFMVYLTQDATPANDSWLNEMLEPFGINEKIVAVLGRQQPRLNCMPMLKYEIQHVFASQGSPYGMTLYQRNKGEPKGSFTEKTFYSDVCSAARRDFLLKKIGYKPVDYAEDQLFGCETIDAGYIKAYNGKAVVIHSNNIPLKKYKNRVFDETLAMRKIAGITSNISFLSVIKNSIVGSIKDFTRIIRDDEFSRKRKIYWIAMNPFFQLAKWRGVRLGNKEKITNKRSKYSLEKCSEN